MLPVARRPVALAPVSQPTNYGAPTTGLSANRCLRSSICRRAEPIVPPPPPPRTTANAPTADAIGVIHRFSLCAQQCSLRERLSTGYVCLSASRSSSPDQCQRSSARLTASGRDGIDSGVDGPGVVGSLTRHQNGCRNTSLWGICHAVSLGRSTDSNVAQRGIRVTAAHEKRTKIKRV